MVFQEQPRKYIIQAHNLKKALTQELTDFNLLHFDISGHIDHGRYEEAFNIEHDLIKKYLYNTYRHFYNVNLVKSPDDLRSFITLLSKTEDFPFTESELINYLERDYNQVLELEGLELDEKCNKIFRYIGVFLVKIEKYIYDDDD